MMNDLEDKVTDIYHKSKSTLTSVITGPALLVIVAWNLIEWGICLFLGSSFTMWLCGSLLDTAVNCAVILFMVHHRKWNDCWAWAIIIFVFNTIPCLLPMKLGNGYVVDILLILIHVFVICVGDIAGNLIIPIAMTYYPLEYDGLAIINNLIARFTKQPLEQEEQPSQQEEPSNPYVGGFGAPVKSEEMNFGGFGGYAGDETSVESKESTEEETGGGFGGGFS